MIEGYTATVTGTIVRISDIGIDVRVESGSDTAQPGEIMSMTHYHMAQHAEEYNTIPLHKEAVVGDRIACAYETEYVDQWDSDDMIERHTLIDYDLLD